MFRRIRRKIKQRLALYKDSDKAIVIELPYVNLDRKEWDAAELYLYYWFAENIQYFGFKPTPFKTLFRKKKQYHLGQDAVYATFTLSSTFDKYFQDSIKSSERALIRKAIKNGFYCSPISYDEHYEAIIEINRSKAMRGGMSISEDYLHPRMRENIVGPYNPDIRTFGIFTQKGKLVAYYTFEHITNFYHVVKGIGHGDFLKYGIMNYLFAYSIGELYKTSAGQPVVYGLLSNEADDGASHFRRNIGCQGRTIIYEGTKKQFQALQFFTSHYRLHGDSGLNYVLENILQK